MHQLHAVILAAGEGTRMKSRTPKVLQKLCGKPMLQHVLDKARDFDAEKMTVVIGHGADLVRESLSGTDVRLALQAERLGTGHAVKEALKDMDTDDCHVLVLYGDSPMADGDTLKAFFDEHINNDHMVTVLSARVPDPKGYGRIVRDGDGSFTSIVEEKEATQAEKAIDEINSGIMLIKPPVKPLLDKITNNNKKGEYYLTDLVSIARSMGGKVGAYCAESAETVLAANDKAELAQLEEILRRRMNLMHMKNGVLMRDPKAVYIDVDVEIGEDTILYPGTILEGKTKIGAGCTIGPNVLLKDTVVGDDCKLVEMQAEEALIENGVEVGPYAYLRPGTKLENKVKVGRFVEMKKAIIHEGAKVPHLTYMGDAEVGKKANIGAGTITCNYDGKNKFKTTIGDNAFVGCNVNLVAPVTVGSDTYIAAGSTINRDVPDGQFAIARERQTNRDDFKPKTRE